MWLPHWPIQRLGVADERKRQPFVLHELVRGQQRVAACSPAAAARGIRVGMPVAEVLAAFPEIAWEAYDPQVDRTALEELAVCCARFSPLVGLETTFTPDSLLLDITGLDHLFGGEQILAEKLIADLVGRGLMAQVAIADTPGAAWAAAHYADSLGFGVQGSGREAGSTEYEVRSTELAYSHAVLRTSYSTSSLPHAPPQKTEPRTPNPEPLILAPGDFSALWPLPLAALRLSPEVIDLFRQLGIERIDQLEALPREALSARFGNEVLVRLDQTLGRAVEPIVAQQTPPEFLAEGTIEYPTTRRDVLEAVCRRLLVGLSRQLNERGLGALCVACRLACHAATGADAEAFRLQTAPLSVGLFEPSAAPDHLHALLAMQFERLSLPGPVTGITISIPATAAITHRQQSLWDDEPQRPSRRQLAALVERLSGRLGSKAVVGVRLAHEALPELAWQPAALVGGARLSPGQRRSQRPAPSAKDLPPRPATLFRQPEPVAATSLVPNGPPLQFTVQGMNERVVAATGPERIEIGWWRGRMIARDYYRIETAAGSRYWVLRHLYDGRWFVHGKFD